jgi:outer membrane protein OmpA-like peptidoglycan-associated protein
VRLTPFAKTFITLIILAVFGYVGWHYRDKLVPEAATKPSIVPTAVDLAQAPKGAEATSEAKNFRAAGTKAGCTQLPEIRYNLWAWNSQMGLMAATGGKQATEGSLMCEAGVNLRLIREDDPVKMQENLVAFATELKSGAAHPTKGSHFVAIMGDGAAAFLQGLNEVLESKLGPEYTAKIIGSAGYSRGEDKFMGPPEWKTNPAAARGGVVSGYLRDGDWNIAQKWLGDNGLRNNPDEKTYDPDALNWVSADDYIDAAKKYISGWEETRPVVRNGKATGEKIKIKVQGVVTWTPGDVMVAREKGGLVSIVSTKEYSSQMPNAIIGIDKWMKANRPTVESMLMAIFKGGDAVKGNRNAFEHAAAISAEVYGEEDAAYWMRYFNIVTERDRQGLLVELGGSYVNNLGDNLLLFGLVPGSANLLAATYTKFGDVVVQQYPELVPRYPPVDRAIDTAYLRAIAERSGGTKVAEEAAPRYETPTGSAPAKVISRRSWNITFTPGKASFTPQAERELRELARELLVASGTLVQVHGHTDSTGNADANYRLSEERAFAVKQWLMQQSSMNFPSERISVLAHGQTNPVAPNSSEEGRAKNRRVEIVLSVH